MVRYSSSRPGSRLQWRKASRFGDRFQSPPQAQPSVVRLRLVLLVLLGSCILLAINLLRLQFFKAGDLVTRAKQQQTTYLKPFVPRRTVVDRNQNVVAIDQPVYTIFAHPRFFVDNNASAEEQADRKQKIATDLAQILNVSSADLTQKFEKQKTGIRLADRVPEDTTKRIKELYIDGLDFIPSQQRIYPQQDLMANILGYVDVQEKSQGGIEYSYEHLLSRSTKAVQLTRTGLGAVLPDGIPNGFIHQDDLRLQLTIDSRIQRSVHKILSNRVAAFGAKRGLVMVMDAKDGSLLSMVSVPTFDPNNYYKFKDYSVFKNWALTDIYEPGSTFKPVNVAIALEAGTIQLDDYFNDTGSMVIEGWPINNADNAARGSIGLTTIMQYSSNIGMVRIAQTMKPSIYYSWLERVGLGQKTGIDLPFEAEGYLKERKVYMTSPIEVATTSFGQGFAMTPMQLIKLNAMLANGGKMVTPHVVKGLYDSQGRPHWQPERAMPKQIFSPKNTNAILRMMEAVVDYGTGKSAQVAGYRVAGKTGTAQKASEGGGGYAAGRYITSFVGIFPVDQPRYVVLAVLDEPQGLAYGGTTAAPIVKDVIEVVAGVEKVPPSKSDP
ncbi:MAG: penicillin-binding protein 2 [Synechococcales bacterium]|nr:penicillin-binding protein 2 [Synechococcales bacterium]